MSWAHSYLIKSAFLGGLFSAGQAIGKGTQSTPNPASGVAGAGYAAGNWLRNKLGPSLQSGVQNASAAPVPALGRMMANKLMPEGSHLANVQQPNIPKATPNPFGGHVRDNYNY